MWWQFKAGFARKLGYVLAGLLIAFLLGHRAHAGQVCLVWFAGGNGPFADAASACASYGSVYHSYSFTAGGDVTGASPSESEGCTATASSGGAPVTDFAFVDSQAGPCPNNCSSPAGTYDIIPPGNAVAAAGSTACGSNNCSFIMGPASTARTVIARTSTGTMVQQSATTDGSSCDGSNTSADIPSIGGKLDAGTPVDDCTALGGVTTCVTQNSTGTYCGTYNGDYVCLGAQPNGSCVTYKSGGASCTVVSATAVAPGAPDSGTAGTPAIPAEQVTGPTGQTVDYYSAAQVAGSTKGVSTTGVGTTGSVTGSTGSGATGSVAGAASGTASTTCPPGQTCTGTADSFSDGGNCVTPPACLDTDPVLCGIANEEWLFRCESVASSDLQNAIGTVTGPQNTSVDVSASVSETGTATVNAIVVTGDSQCPQPITITVMGKSIQLDLFSYMCQFFTQMSVFVMAVAYMLSVRVMFTGAVSNSF